MKWKFNWAVNIDFSFLYTEKNVTRRRSDMFQGKADDGNWKAIENFFSQFTMKINEWKSLFFVSAILDVGKLFLKIAVMRFWLEIKSFHDCATGML